MTTPLTQRPAFAALRSHFDAIKGTHLRDLFKADPARTLVIEDSVHGIAGARAAGMRVVGFTGASHSYPSHADRLTEAGAETVISRMSELPMVIEALAEWQAAI